MKQLKPISLRAIKYGGEVRVQLLRLSEPETSILVDTPERAFRYWHSHIAKAPWFDPEKEMAVVLCLDTKLKISAYSLVSLGCLNETYLHPREVFRAAIAASSYGVVLMHNHPSGDPSPSQSDKTSTTRMIECARILGLVLVDHVIVGSRSHRRQPWFSFREFGTIA